MATLIRTDLDFILQQILIAEAHAAGADLTALVPNVFAPLGGGHAYRSGIGNGVVLPVAAAPAAQRPVPDVAWLRPTRTAARGARRARRPGFPYVPRSPGRAAAPMLPFGSPVAPLC